MRKLTKREKILLYAVISLFLATVGAFLNYSVVHNNNCKMPVYTRDYDINDNSHFTFTEKEQVNYFFLTDLIHVYFIREGFYSVGDILIFAGSFSFFILVLRFVWINYIMVT